MNETPNAQFRGTHDLGEIIGMAYRLYAANFTQLFLIALITAPMTLLTVIVDRQIDDDSAAQGFVGLMQLAAALISIVASAALVHAIHDISGGTPPNAGRSLDAVFERLPQLFVTAILLVALLMAASIAAPFLAVYWLFKRDATIDGRRDWYLALIPFALFAYLAVRWGFAVQAYAIEGQRAWSALDASADAVRGQWWRTLGILIVVGLLQVGPALISAASMLAAPLVEGTITSLVSALVLPFGLAAATLLYYDLKARKSSDHSPATIDAPQSDVPGQSP